MFEATLSNLSHTKLDMLEAGSEKENLERINNIDYRIYLSIGWSIGLGEVQVLELQYFSV